MTESPLDFVGEGAKDVPHEIEKPLNQETMGESTEGILKEPVSKPEAPTPTTTDILKETTSLNGSSEKEEDSKKKSLYQAELPEVDAKLIKSTMDSFRKQRWTFLQGDENTGLVYTSKNPNEVIKARQEALKPPAAPKSELPAFQRSLGELTTLLSFGVIACAASSIFDFIHPAVGVIVLLAGLGLLGYLALQFNTLKTEVEEEVEKADKPADAPTYVSQKLKSELILAGHPDDLIKTLSNAKLRSEWDPLCFSAKQVSSQELLCKYHNLSGGVTEQTLKYVS